MAHSKIEIHGQIVGIGEPRDMRPIESVPPQSDLPQLNEQVSGHLSAFGLLLILLVILFYQNEGVLRKEES